jgi:DHA1 family multidrug resistance protein-like MFS transporter
MFNTLGLNWGNSLLGFLTIAFIPIVYLLWWKGDKLRARSKNASHAFINDDNKNKKGGEQKQKDGSESDEEKTFRGDRSDEEKDKEEQ